MDSSKLEKYNTMRSRHLGNSIRELVNECGFTSKEVATYLEVGEDQLEKIYQSRSIDMEKLLKLSKLLQHNFFIHYLDNEVIGSLFEHYVKDLAPQVSYLIRELEAKDDQLAQLRALTETQRKIIEILETREFLEKSTIDG